MFDYKTITLDTITDKQCSIWACKVLLTVKQLSLDTVHEMNLIELE